MSIVMLFSRGPFIHVLLPVVFSRAFGFPFECKIRNHVLVGGIILISSLSATNLNLMCNPGEQRLNRFGVRLC